MTMPEWILLVDCLFHGPNRHTRRIPKHNVEQCLPCRFISCGLLCGCVALLVHHGMIYMQTELWLDSELLLRHVSSSTSTWGRAKIDVIQSSSDVHFLSTGDSPKFRWNRPPRRPSWTAPRLFQEFFERTMTLFPLLWPCLRAKF